jgi:hypothetical protein
MIPAYITIASIALLSLQAIYQLKSIKRLRQRIFPGSNINGADQVENEPGHTVASSATGLFVEVKEHIFQQGGIRTFVCLFLQLASCISLFTLSIISLVLVESEREGNTSHFFEFGAYVKWGKNNRGRHKLSRFTQEEWLHGAMCMTHVRLITSGVFSIHDWLDAISSMPHSLRSSWFARIKSEPSMRRGTFAYYYCAPSQFMRIEISHRLLHTTITQKIVTKAGVSWARR